MADTKSPSAARKAVDYAEKDLGVHIVFEVAQTRRTMLDSSLTQLAAERDHKRDLEVQITDREMELTLDEAGHHPEMSVAAMDRHMKQVLARDELLRQLKGDLSSVISNIEGTEYDIRIHETDIKIAVARMTELGGYLQYLAAIKLNQVFNKTSEAGEAR